MRGQPRTPSYNEGCQLAAVNPGMRDFQQRLQPVLAELMKGMNALKRDRANLQYDNSDWNEHDPGWPITILNGHKGAAKGQTGKG